MAEASRNPENNSYRSFHWNENFTENDFKLQDLLSGPEIDAEALPSHLTQMSDLSKDCALAYCVLFIVAAIGNTSVLISVSRKLRRFKTRISLLLLHLCVADLFVTFFLMPMEILWRITVQWYGGDVLCKVCQFFRAFGLYLSSMLVICISLDRFFAVIYPLKLASGTRRVRIMLFAAWTSAAVFAAPQVLLL